ncbi:MAG: putative nuclease [Prokaryotic dsDNA virus sp.]|nr:MAG: putative nuclease [Prokaryotic dsDNA virus sp.]|tara:strand:+ start:369 stop:701 length:333 start_codon:yes stop_codon:yes gene_type:complete
MAESKIQTKIIKHLQSRGVYCWRNNNAAIWDPKLNNGRGGYRFSSQGKRGVADILGVLPGGQHLEIEVKSAVGVQSPEQKIHQKRVEDLGGMYIVARSVKDIDHLCPGNA